MNLLEAFENGLVNGISGFPDRIVETMISKLFFFGPRVFKVYKWWDGPVGNFSEPDFRRDFFSDDFRWNVTMSPSIYLRLGFVGQSGGHFVEVPESFAEDFFIEMQAIDERDILFDRLASGTVSEKELRAVVSTMIERIKGLTVSVRDEFSDIFSLPLFKLNGIDMESTKEWIRMTEGFPFRVEALTAADRLIGLVPVLPVFRNFDTKRYLAAIDNHVGNIILENGRPSFIDSMPPLRIWRAQTPLYIVSRPATDVEVLIGREFADSMYDEYARVTGDDIDPIEKAYCQTVSALIMSPYMYIQKKPELSRKYLDFSIEKISEI